MRYIDVSPQLDADSVVWPGDHEFRRVSRWSVEAGDAVSVSTVTTTTHIGAHIDAPSHVQEGAATIEATPIEACIGSCLVIDVADLVIRSSSPHGFVRAHAIRMRIEETLERHSPEILPERILLRHRTAALTQWDSHTPGIDPEFIRWFGAQGGLLIGLDLASFDPEQSKDLPAHHAAVEAGVVMLEGLDLSEAADGVAQLVALPVSWRGADAAPVRAVLSYPN